jgi:hypothetical protein
VPPGPHHFKSERSGLGELKATLRGLPADCGMASTVSDLQAMDARFNSISLLPKPSYGASSSTLKATAGTGAAMGMASTSGSSSSCVPDDFGSPAFSETMRALAHEVRPLNPNHQMHKAKRAPLPRMRMADVPRLAASGADAAPDTLVVLVLMADWSPACVKLEPAMQVTNGELLAEASAAPACPSSKVRIYKVDASEGATLQKQYHFRTVPMYLSYYQGNLTAAGNDFGGSAEFKVGGRGGGVGRCLGYQTVADWLQLPSCLADTCPPPSLPPSLPPSPQHSRRRASSRSRARARGSSCRAHFRLAASTTRSSTTSSRRCRWSGRRTWG